MTAQTSDQIAANWASRLGASGTKITAGVNAVTVAPGQAAARQQAAYVSNVQAAAGKWASNVAAVSLQSWQSDMTTKGVPRIATGATAAVPKFTSFMTQLLPAINTAKSALPPRGSLDQNVARMTQFVTAMSKFKKGPGA